MATLTFGDSVTTIARNLRTGNRQEQKTARRKRLWNNPDFQSRLRDAIDDAAEAVPLAKVRDGQKDADTMHERREQVYRWLQANHPHLAWAYFRLVRSERAAIMRSIEAIEERADTQDLLRVA